MEEKERRAWSDSRGYKLTHQNLWGQVFKRATKQQLDRRELNSDLDATEYQPRRIHFSESAIYYIDHEGKFWDQVSGNQLNSEEVVAARLDETKQLYAQDVYDKLPLSECWQSTGRALVLVKWIDINKGDDVDHDYWSRLVAEEIRRDKRLDLFAATPPWSRGNYSSAPPSSMKVGFKEGETQSGMEVDFIDISQAFFQSDAIRGS